jgi:signal transduction histidine kinase
MVNLLASRIAGLKLSSIVVALLIPIAVLAYFLNSELGARSRFTERELEGVRFVRAVMPVLIAVARDETNANAITELERLGEEPVQSLGLSESYAAFLNRVKQEPGNRDGLFDTAKGLIAAAGERSNLVRDPESEAYHVMSAAVVYATEIVSGLKDLRTVTGKAAEAGNGSKVDASHAFEIIGRLEYFVERAKQDMNLAADGQLDRAVYVDAIAGLEAISGSLDAHAKLLRDGPADSAYSIVRHAEVIEKESVDLVNKVGAFTQSMLPRLEELLVARNQGLGSRSTMTFLVSLGSIILSLATAVQMFKSTLRRLDDLETSSASAEGARRDAEDMNTRLSEINADIIHLNQELGDKVKRLKDAQDELLKKGRMEQLGQLTATVAHELRNPLGAVRTSAFLLERKTKGKGLGIEPQLQRINNGIMRCDAIITQLLDFSRTKQISAVAADLDDWLAKTVEEEAKRLSASITIECILGLDARDIPFDPSRMQRAVINLMSNAAEAMVGTGEDIAKFTTANPKIVISSKIEGEYAVVSVEDNGPGIAPEILKKIREPLFTTKSFGTGLGIPAVEQIVVQHGGRLEIKSKPGEGAVFRLFLPLTSLKEDAA